MKIVIICASNHPGIFDSCWFSAFLCYYPLLSPGALAAPLITKKGGGGVANQAGIEVRNLGQGVSLCPYRCENRIVFLLE